MYIFGKSNKKKNNLGKYPIKSNIYYNKYMKTYDIFINFECISGIFARKLNKSFNQIPLSYTIGYRNKQQEIKTIFEIFNFRKNIPINNNFSNYILEDFAKSLISNIGKLINKKEIIKLNEINFIGWNQTLEKELLLSIFKEKIIVNSLIERGFEKNELSIKREISLTKITKNGYKEINYFLEFKKEINKKLSKETIEKLNLNHCGALASYSGFVIYNIIKKTRKTKYHIYMSETILTNELKLYSLDDINRMYYFLDNLNKVKKMIKNIEITDKLKKEININSKLLITLHEYNGNLKIKDLIKKIKSDNEKYSKKIKLFED